ncbi:substrate-binding domain-containing protein [Streptomyces hainanensis]|uniref:histidine kinase n=1 Tax=Streptomyces hainanensis TaxID=402648 RepID=A0A4R4TAJ0_9ACTN|nr:substrate-binding domain-containing protein [Streptomyces hainanensis]TDC74177.1 helix-turn-helix domain-containing protein [Streptomyces hainanensis]
MAEHGSPPAWQDNGRRPRSPRPTIGLVTANIHLGVGASLWSGVLEAAEREDVNIVCFPGDALTPGGAPRNAVYELLDRAGLDGAICWTSTLGLPVGGERAATLVRRLGGLGQVISLNRALDGHETLLLDSYAGMRKAVGHLVEHHGRRRLACLRGPMANPVALDRFRAFSDALARHRIPRDRALVSASLDYAAGAGASAMRVLLDVRGLRPGRDFDAVVACSDVLAADALRLLTERGVRVPEDVALISFNDSVEARISDPPLTSVALPFGELGSLAVETILARLRGVRPPERRVVPGTLVIRRSCGCPTPLVMQGGEGPEPASEPAPAPAPAGLPGSPLDEELLATLRADAAEPADPAGGGPFLSGLERRVGAVQSFEDAAAWDRALLRLRAAAPPSARAERLVGQARLMVADKSRRLLEYDRWTLEQESRRLRALSTTLTTAVDLAEIDAALDRHLPRLAVPGHRLVVAGDGPPRDTEPPPLPPPDGEHRFTAVLEPLHIGEEPLGYAVFDAGPRAVAARHGALYRALGEQISAALKGVRLFTEVRRARDAAEQASSFKTRLLGNATDELRSPVEAILGHTAPGDPAHEEAARLLRLIDDLLDLSRSEIDALGLDRRLLDPRPLLAEVFQDTVAGGHLRLPRRLPALCADPDRLRQIVHNLLTAAGPYPDLIVDVDPPRLTVLVTGPELAAPAHEPAEDERYFQPFAARGPGGRLGLAMARRLAVLHGGSLALHRGPGPFGFRLDLPLPTPAEPTGPHTGEASPGRTLLVVERTLPELAAVARRHGLRPHRPHPDEDIATVAAGHPPAAVAWDAGQATPQEWATVRRLHDHPALRNVPFLLYGPVAGRDLNQALHALRPSGVAAPAVVVGGSAASREAFRRLLTGVLPGRTVRAAADGTAALALLAEEAPGLLVVERTLPDMDGFELVDRLWHDCPVLMLSAAGFTFSDVRRAEPHPRLLLLGRGILTEEETARLLTSLTSSASDPQRQQRAADPAPVRYALAYIEQHYRHRFSRWQIAQAAGVSEDHLGRLFHRELGLTLWEYLTRLRIERAKERLQRSDDNVQTIARAVGFHDRAYFSRVFRRLTGVAPHAYRDAS